MSQAGDAVTQLMFKDTDSRCLVPSPSRSSLSTFQARRQAAFTLIELVVVLFIIGIVASFATLSIGQQGDARLQTEAKRLQHLIRLASDEAISQTREYALQIGKNGYAFLVLDKDGKFAPIKDDQMFRAREFDPDIQVKLELNGEAVTFADDQAPPQIYLLSSGEIAPLFRLLLTDVDGVMGQYQIAVGDDGRTSLTTLSGGGA